MRIAEREIGRGSAPYFVADVGANHDGSLDRAKSLIALAAKAGADAVKFQNFAAETIVSRRGFADLGRIGHQARWSRDVYETYQAASVPLDWVPRLAQACADEGVTFLTTAYSPEILDAVDEYVPAHKVGSGDVTYLDYLRLVAAKGKPILLATGASGGVDVWRALYEGVWYDTPDVEVVLLQCNSNYEGGEANFRHLNLAVLSGWAADRPVELVELGFSDHTPGFVAAVIAVALGASVIEKHLTDDPARDGPDHAFAMTPGEWRAMVDAAGAARFALGDGVKKIEENEADAVVVQRRALRYTRSLEAGYVLGVGDVFPTRPCPPEGLPPYEIAEVVGRVLRRNVTADDLVRREHL